MQVRQVCCYDHSADRWKPLSQALLLCICCFGLRVSMRKFITVELVKLISRLLNGAVAS